jgi:EpsI family protein
MTTPDMKIERRAFLAAAGMIAASGAAMALRPSHVAATPVAKLDVMVPTQFGTWRVDDQQEASVVNPNLQQILETIYTDTLSRVYLGPDGQRMMLALAYGQNQNRDLQVHKPEVCYVAQGFRLLASEKVDVTTAQGRIPAMRLVAQMGPRIEPITYWIRVGDRVIRGWLEQNIARVELGLHGQLPDGLLVRVSSIDSDRAEAFAQQQVFLSDMLKAIAPAHLGMFIGNLAA